MRNATRKLSTIFRSLPKPTFKGSISHCHHVSPKKKGLGWKHNKSEHVFINKTPTLGNLAPSHNALSIYILHSVTNLNNSFALFQLHPFWVYDAESFIQIS